MHAVLSIILRYQTILIHEKGCIWSTISELLIKYLVFHSSVIELTVRRSIDSKK
jgi:hypothetical protein